MIVYVAPTHSTSFPFENATAGGHVVVENVIFANGSPFKLISNVFMFELGLFHRFVLSFLFIAGGLTQHRSKNPYKALLPLTKNAESEIPRQRFLIRPSAAGI
jgi:hypothetical protein